MSKPIILVILASTRQGRMGETVANWFKALLPNRTNASYEFVDLRDWQLPYLDEPGSVTKIEAAYDPQGIPGRWRDKIAGADGYIIITPEYNHGYPAVLKTALDALYTAWQNKPVGFVSYGGISGGTRAVEQLRTVVIELRMAPMSKAVHIPFVRKAFDEQGKPTGEGPEKQSVALFDQLEWWATVLKEGKVAHPLGTVPT